MSTNFYTNNFMPISEKMLDIIRSWDQEENDPTKIFARDEKYMEISRRIAATASQMHDSQCPHQQGSKDNQCKGSLSYLVQAMKGTMLAHSEDWCDEDIIPILSILCFVVGEHNGEINIEERIPHPARVGKMLGLSKKQIEKAIEEAFEEYVEKHSKDDRKNT